MKKILIILTILAADILIISCQKELPAGLKYVASKGGNSEAIVSPEISLDLEDLEFTAESGSKVFNIKSNISWTVSSDKAWCNVSPSSGNDNGSVTVMVSENPTTSSRTATITVRSVINILTVKVVQNGADATISLDISAMEFTSSSGEKSLSITSNTSWTLSSDQEWCSVSPSLGSNSSSVSIKVSENTSTSERSATVTVTTDVGIRTVKVTQAGATAVLAIGVTNLDFISDSGSNTFNITSNTSWKVASDQSWCTVSPKAGSNDGSVTVSVDENISTFSRTAAITVKSTTISRTLAVTQSGATPVTPSMQDRTFTVGGVTFKMIAVEGGTFTMGATSEQGDDAEDTEKPTHIVTLSSYCIGETEVTQALWQAVMGSNPSSFKGSQKPVEEVSWDKCQDFISKLNTITGEKFRLPTEAEWEYAARGGNKSKGYKYAGSNTIDNVAWYSSNSNNQTHNVATKQANELGLYDMSGNVMEWCNDWYVKYNSSSQTNPTGPTSGDYHYRVYRGGCWRYYAKYSRTSFRTGITPTSFGWELGLRLAL